MRPMGTLTKENWVEPLDLARGIEEDFILLYSGLRLPFSGRYSILAIKPKETVTSSSFDDLESKLSSDKQKFENAWFGYLGYGLKNTLEKLPSDDASFINLPELYMASYCLTMVFDHEKKEIKLYGDESLIPTEKGKSSLPKTSIKSILSNMNRDEYLSKVSVIKEAIKNGDLYQANLTRKFSGEFEEAPDGFAIFSSLCAISPAPYSSFIKMGDKYVISSSPERFVSIDSTGNADSRPIKGSAPRFEESEKDNSSKEHLKNSEKDRAENLMIVDLMRNDFSRSSKTGSVEVESLYDITSYSTVHHMSSTIKSQKAANVSTLDFIKNCFPPGSMTGTPKIKAMELCSQLEKQKRGVYSGAIGYFGGDGSADFSVVIRTIIIDGNKFEFQVGGAIINDSNADLELEETMIKAKAVSKSINIELDRLKAI